MAKEGHCSIRHADWMAARLRRNPWQSFYVGHFSFRPLSRPRLRRISASEGVCDWVICILVDSQHKVELRHTTPYPEKTAMTDNPSLRHHDSFFLNMNQPHEVDSALDKLARLHPGLKRMDLMRHLVNASRAIRPSEGREKIINRASFTIEVEKTLAQSNRR
jgi:hypothetical protein